MTTRTLVSTEVDRYREVRLEALAADPQAFCSTWEREAAFDESTWSARLGVMDGRPAATIVDEVDGRVCGVVGVGLTAAAEVATLVGMWVRPEARGSGAAGRLVEAALAWAAEHGVGTVELGVIAGNDVAIACYRRCGFELTGVTGPVPGRPVDTELQMRRSTSS